MIILPIFKKLLQLLIFVISILNIIFIVPKKSDRKYSFYMNWFNHRFDYDYEQIDFYLKLMSCILISLFFICTFLDTIY